VATPIGNLEDITLRALRVLREADLIAAEDTRRTRKLLEYYKINTPLTSCFADKELKQGEKIIRRLLNGENVALVTDAGTPGISDPGDRLVKLALDSKVLVASIPGASALTAALSISGVGGSRFVFHGFLPRQGKKRAGILRKATRGPEPQVFFESPLRTLQLLENLAELCPQRQVVVVREISKIYEETLQGSAAALLSDLENEKMQGEIIVILGWDKEAADDFDAQPLDLPLEVSEILKKFDIPAKAAAALIAAVLHKPRREIYKALVDDRNSNR
jgi:16S rRNA (cytidine1402-2'-O)-methyltransferase